MKSCSLALVFFSYSLSFASSALADKRPHHVRSDDRIYMVSYERDNTVTLHGTLGIATVIFFHPDEQITTVVMGDTQSWTAVLASGKRALVIRPLEKTALTDLVVITNKDRTYTFHLRSGLDSGENPIYTVRFTYPDDPVSTGALRSAKKSLESPNLKAAFSSGAINWNYAYKGGEVVKPISVFDDGIKTFFEFPRDVPSIFEVNSDLSETLINFRKEGKYIVVDTVSPQWTLRAGSDTTCVFNLNVVPSAPSATVMTDLQPERQTIHASENESLLAPFRSLLTATKD